MNDKKLTQTHHSQVYDNFLIHWKYIKREKVNGKWKYFYNNDEYQAYKKAAINESVAAVKLKNTIKARQVAEKAMIDAAKRLEKATAMPGDSQYMHPDTSTGFHFLETKKGKLMNDAEYDMYTNADKRKKHHTDMMEANSNLSDKRNSAAEAKTAYEQTTGAKLANLLTKAANKIDAVTNKIAETVDDGKNWLESKFSSKVPKPELSDPNGKEFVENILVEDILYEDIIKDNIIKDNIIEDDIIEDDIIKDDIIKDDVLKNDKIPMSSKEQRVVAEAEKKAAEKKELENFTYGFNTAQNIIKAGIFKDVSEDVIDDIIMDTVVELYPSMSLNEYRRLSIEQKQTIACAVYAAATIDNGMDPVEYAKKDVAKRQKEFDLAEEELIKSLNG